MTRSVDCVLFDADGVLQRTPDGWQQDLMALDPEDPSGFLTEVFEAEIPAVRGQIGLRDALMALFEQRRINASVDVALELWSRLVVDDDMLAAIAELRRDGVLCALATNQHDVRAKLMRALPEYRDVFDAEFYSCEVGSYKPQAAFFRTAVDTLGLDPGRTLFVDDRQNNVDGARSIGLLAEVFAEHGGRPELERILALHHVAH